MTNGMSAEERRKFEDLKRRRDNLRRAHKENDSDLYRFLAEQYSDPSHFIYELLQNAEDACASKVLFVLTEGGLDVSHNGDDFRFRNIEAITGIGDSTKKEELTKIGEFGIGFKSVFAITSTPYIYSGNYNIKIEDLYVPCELNKPPEDRKYDTLIKLPFNHGKFTKKKVTKDKAFEITNEELENLKPKTLLFLKNIKKIKWEIKKGTLYSEGSISRRSKYIGESRSINVKEVNLSATEKGEKYLVFDRPFKAKKGKTKKRSIEVAFKLDKGKLVREENSKLVVFFPTEKDTFLNFVIQGPYVTTPNRESIPEGNEENQRIIDKTGELVTDCLHTIKNHNDLKHLYVDFLNLLPIDLEKRSFGRIYLTLYDKVAKKLKSEKLLPTLDGGYAYSENSLLSSERVYEILNKADMGRLYPKQSWIDTRITREFWNYLRRVIKVEPVNFTNLMRKVCEYGTEDFMRKKTDIWMIAFYTKLLAHGPLWKRYGDDPFLRYEPIIRLNTGEHTSPFVRFDKRKKPQVYLPTKGRSYHSTVKEKFSKNKKSRKFLIELGLKEPNLHDYVREVIIPKYQGDTSVSNNEWLQDLREILKSYSTIQSDEKIDMKKQLLRTKFIFSVNNSGAYYRCIPELVYIPNDGLREFFRGYESAYFVDEEKLKKDKSGKLGEFLKGLGVASGLRRVEKRREPTSEESIKIWNSYCYPRGGNPRNESIVDYEYSGLENFLAREINLDRSLLLWNLLLEHIESLPSWVMWPEMAKCQWHYYNRPYSEQFDAMFLKTLNGYKWLVDKSGELRHPSDIKTSELSDSYVTKSDSAKILIKGLDFIEEEQLEIPELEDLETSVGETVDRKIEELREAGVSEEKIEKFRKKLEEDADQLISEAKGGTQVQQVTWTPTVESSKAVSKSNKLEFNEIDNPSLPGHLKKGSERQEKNHENDEDEQDELSAVDKKKIGEWGEEHVVDVYLPKTYLPKEYQVQDKVEETDTGFKVIEPDGCEVEVEWLNKNGDTGVGYDICIKRGGDEVKYIEVKSTTRAEPRTIDIQGTQWGVAETLFKRGEGGKYSIWVVPNVGNKTLEIIEIDDPVKLWRENKLRAHPVRLKLPKNTQDD